MSTWGGVACIAAILVFTAGFVAGWAARTDGNAQWRRSFDRKLQAAELRSARAESERIEATQAADYAYAEMHRVPAQAAPVIHVHVAPAVPEQAMAQAIAAAAQPALTRTPAVLDG